MIKITYCGCLMRSCLIKSLASGEMWVKASSANSQSHRCTLAKVSRSSSPAKGDNPLNLYKKTIQIQNVVIYFKNRNLSWIKFKSILYVEAIAKTITGNSNWLDLLVDIWYRNLKKNKIKFNVNIENIKQSN